MGGRNARSRSQRRNRSRKKVNASAPAQQTSVSDVVVDEESHIAEADEIRDGEGQADSDCSMVSQASTARGDEGVAQAPEDSSRQQSASNTPPPADLTSKMPVTPPSTAQQLSPLSFTSSYRQPPGASRNAAPHSGMAGRLNSTLQAAPDAARSESASPALGDAKPPQAHTGNDRAATTAPPPHQNGTGQASQQQAPTAALRKHSASTQSPTLRSRAHVATSARPAAAGQAASAKQAAPARSATSHTAKLTAGQRSEARQSAPAASEGQPGKLPCAPQRAGAQLSAQQVNIQRCYFEHLQHCYPQGVVLLSRLWIFAYHRPTWMPPVEHLGT